MGKVNNQMVGAIGNMRILADHRAKRAIVFRVDRHDFSSPVTTFDMVFDSQTEIDGRQVPITSPAFPLK